MNEDRPMNTGSHPSYRKNQSRAFGVHPIAAVARALILLGLFAATHATLALDPDNFHPLFNGRNLAGWTNVNCAPETWIVRDGVIHCTGHPIGALRTVREYENFILELEWRHLSSGGNSGVFIWASAIAANGVPFLRAIEVQVLDHGFNVPGKNEWYTTHGDVFPIHGSTMKPFGRHNGMRSFPSEERSKGTPEWNHYRIVCTNGVIRLHVNGKEVSGGEDCNYRKGYIGLESEGGPIDFRNLRIEELPSSGAPPDSSAPEDPGWRSLFTGLDLHGWKTNAVANTCSVQNERLIVQSTSSNSEAFLETEQEFGDVEFVVDCRSVKNKSASNSSSSPLFRLREVGIPLDGVEPDKFHRFIITLRRGNLTLKRDNDAPTNRALPAGAPNQTRLGLAAQGGAFEFMNIYARPL